MPAWMVWGITYTSAVTQSSLMFSTIPTCAMVKTWYMRMGVWSSIPYLESTHVQYYIHIYILYKYKNININIYIYRHILMRTDWWSSPCVYIIRDFTPKKTARWRFSNFASGTGSAGRGSGGGGITKESASESWEDSESFRSWVICGV